jgi:hypothetical protein
LYLLDEFDMVLAYGERCPPNQPALNGPTWANRNGKVRNFWDSEVRISLQARFPFVVLFDSILFPGKFEII